jgi:hypothetical protein
MNLTTAAVDLLRCDRLRADRDAATDRQLDALFDTCPMCTTPRHRRHTCPACGAVRVGDLRMAGVT